MLITKQLHARPVAIQVCLSKMEQSFEENTSLPHIEDKAKNDHRFVHVYLFAVGVSSSNEGSGDICVLSLSKTWVTDLIRLPPVSSSTSVSLETANTTNRFHKNRTS